MKLTRSETTDDRMLFLGDERSSGTAPSLSRLISSNLARSETPSQRKKR